MTNQQSFSIRIRNARTLADLRKAETSLDRLYNAGVFSPGEYRLFDQMILRRVIGLEVNLNVAVESLSGFE